MPVGGLHVLDLPPAMARAQEVLLAVFHPLDWPRQVPREVGGENGLGIRVDLRGYTETLLGKKADFLDS